MRAVTFSTPEIQNAIQNNFVALTSNIVGSDLAGESIVHQPNDQPGSCIRGNGRQNVQTIFLTPDLKVIHAVTGFIGPRDLYKEMEFAVKVKQQMDLSPDRQAEVVQMLHRDRLKELHAMKGTNDSANDIRNRALGTRPDWSINSGANPMRKFEVNNIAKDHDFLIRFPLISAKQLEADPGALVGRGKTFFSSTNNSSNARSKR